MSASEQLPRNATTSQEWTAQCKSLPVDVLTDLLSAVG